MNFILKDTAIPLDNNTSELEDVAGWFIVHRPRLTVLVWDVKEPTHCSERVGECSRCDGLSLILTWGHRYIILYFLMKIVNCVEQSGKVPHKVL